MVFLGGWVFIMSEVPPYPCTALGVAALSLALSPAFSPASLSLYWDTSPLLKKPFSS